jgi:hypothetical protein
LAIRRRLRKGFNVLPNILLVSVPKMAVMIAARVMLMIAACFAVSSASAQSHEFSADLVIRHAEHAEHDFFPANGKLNVSGRKVRIETPDLAMGYFIIRDDVGAAYFVRPVQRVFTDA